MSEVRDDGRRLDADKLAEVAALWADEEVHEEVELGRNELPPIGEWKRACADRSVMEKARAEHVPAEDSDIIHMNVKLKGERFICIPHGAYAVSFIWKLDREVN